MTAVVAYVGRRLGARDERGVALLIVMLVMLVLTLLSVGLVTEVVGQLPLARGVQDRQAAQQAAQAGVEDYLSRLNTDSSYSSGAAATVTSWTPMPGASNSGRFRYSAAKNSNGTIDVTATGCDTAIVNGACRSGAQTVRVRVARSGVLSDVYFSDLEVLDPMLAKGTCDARHLWDTVTDTCPAVAFTSGDTLSGPVHSNDALRVCGSATFTGPVDSYYNSANGYGFRPAGYVAPADPSKDCSGSASFGRLGDPAAGSDLLLPADSGLLAAADPTRNPPATTGCLFSGPTDLALRYDTATGAGAIDYTSPDTDFAGPTWNPSVCGRPVAGPSGTIPADALTRGLVVYVQKVPAANSHALTCLATGCDGDARVGNARDAVLAPGQYGGLAGQLTVGADNNIMVTNNVTYRSLTGDDVLGLVATNSVIVSQPAPSDLTIDAAIVALHHSFYLQQWDQGPALGTLTVHGAIAQEFAGPVAAAGSGYRKAYSYDTRLAALSPPDFVGATVVTWRKISFTVLNACEVPSGTC